MDNDFPKVIGEVNGEFQFEKCSLCENDAMMGIDGVAFCGMHYAEKMGWLEQVVDKDIVLPENLIPEVTNG